jgi:hypothetical protein
MNLQTVEIPRKSARAQAAEYRRAAKTITDPDRRREFEEIARAYRIAARDEVPMIALTPTIAAGGTVTRTLVGNRGTDRETRQHYLLPRLCACIASAAYAYTLGVQRDGSLEIVDSLSRTPRYRRGMLRLDTRFELPEEFVPGQTLLNGSRWWRQSAWQSMVPIVPPRHRPAVATTLASYLVLWEVDTWTWASPPLPPGDPALLRHVGGDIYAVLATWDLTELERLVLAGRRPE